MKKIIVAFCAVFVCLGTLSVDADAKRLGGGMSSGIKRDSTVMNRSTAPTAPVAPTQAMPAKPAVTPQAPAPSGLSRWAGPLAGLAAGIGLAALFSHFGIGEGMGSMLMIMALVFGAIFIIKLLFRRPQAAGAMQYAGTPAPERYEPVAPIGSAAATVAAPAFTVPDDFDVNGFLRNAKLNFVRLQAANDAGNLDDIRQFTTPEMYAEIKLQLDERGKLAQQTDVVQIDAQLLDLTTEEKRHIASVRFHGQIREEANAAPEAFDEVWHLIKPADGSSGWVIAGIQQVQ